jgi:hypothetical protein
MALAIAHCGDGSNNSNGNDNGRPKPTKTAVPGKTSTPASTPVGTPVTSPSTSTSGITATATPSGISGSPCPAAIAVVGDAANARLDSGWTGLAHNSKIITRGEATVATDCSGKPRPCGVCNLTGPIANPDAGQGVSNNHRCSNNPSIECTDDTPCSAKTCLGGSQDGKPCTAGSDCDSNLCPAAGTCQFFFGAPLPLAAGGVSTCVVNQIVGGISGTANIETGDSASTVHLTSSVFNGILLAQPCPECVGDTTIADGKRDGHCNGGARDTLSCDAGGESPEFISHGTTSFDCPPLPGAKIGALPINLSNSTGTTTHTLSSANPDCRDGGGKCFCDTCADVNKEPCSTDADCPGGAKCGGPRCNGGANNGASCSALGASSQCPGGVCTIPGQPTASNQCQAGSTCVADTENALNGHCSEGPVDSYCSPHDTFQGCASAADCPTAGDTCSLMIFRPCFLDNGQIGGSVSAFGKADVPVGGVSHPTLSSLFCIGPTTSPSVNTAAGLPGLGRLSLPATAREIAP